MAVVRRISIIDFKEIILNTPQGEDYVVVSPTTVAQTPGFTVNVQSQPQRQLVGTYGLDQWGFFVNGKQIFPDDGVDTNGDGIPDYLTLDIDNNGVVDGGDGFGNQDFFGLIKRTLLLAKIRITEYYDQYKTIDEIYQDIQNNVPITSTYSEPAGWVVIAESKPSFYYERCGTAYGSNFYFGRIPVCFNYFDLDDIWVDENTNGSWPLVSGEGSEPLTVIGNVDIRITSQIVASRTGFEWNFGPDLEDMPTQLEMKFIQQYVPFVVNEEGRPLFPNMRRNPQNLATIKTEVSPVNLHIASRFDILDDNNLNQSSFSIKPFQTQFPDLPNDIPFRDGSKKRWGRPRYAIQRGFLVNDVKYTGACIPVPGDEEEDTPITTTTKRTLVTIADVLSGKVKMDGTNYIRGVITAHFTYPLMSATLQDISNIYYSYQDQFRKGVNLFYSEFGSFNRDNYESDPFVFAREMRSVIYVQDDTAGMELLGTDFYSSEGIESQNLPGTFTVDGEILQLSNEVFDRISSELGSYDEDPLESFIPTDFKAGAFGREESSPSPVQRQRFFGNININKYFETDTGYLPERYHFKVGDFIEVYNLNILKRRYAWRSCKLVNNEYKIIPNDVDDVMKFFEENGYIKDVGVEDLAVRNQFERINHSNYDYSDQNSIHNTEHCLIRVRDVSFGNIDSLQAGSALLEPNNPMTIYRNDQSPFIDPSNPSSSEWDDWGYRFEPGKKYVIFDASSPTPQNSAVGRHRIFLYNAPTTEMSKYLLPLPGRNTDLNMEYLNWLNSKKNSDPPNSKYEDYKWPLDIIGIQKFGFSFDGLNDSSYMIMPRSMADFGISSENYHAIRGFRKDTVIANDKESSDKNNGSSTGGSTGGGSAGGSSSGGPGARQSTCFAKGTRIMVPTGFKNIEDIEVGEQVITFDMNLKLHERTVTRTYVHDKNESSDIYRYEFSDGTILDVTENHPFLTNDMQFIHIGDLSIGDSIMTIDKNTVQIVSKEFIRNDVVYNIEVQEFNAYVVENICVHNLTKTSPDLNTILEGPGLV